MICESDAMVASTRYRALQFVPDLSEKLGAVDTFLPAPPTLRGPGRPDKARFFAEHALAYARRTRELSRAVTSYQSLFVQRGVYPLGPDLVTRPIVSFDGPVVLDIDDAVFVPRPAMANKGRVANWLYGSHQATALLARADHVVAGSDELAELVAAERPSAHVIVLPTIPDPHRYPVATHAERSPVRVAWIGNAGNQTYLDAIADVLRRLTDDGTITFEVVSSSPWKGPGSFRRWTLAEEASAFADYDLTIMPLPDTPYTRAKAGFKLLQSLAAGVGVIASPVGVNASLLERSGAGIAATTPGEWEDALRRAAGDVSLRRRFGAQGRAFALETCDIARHAARIAELLER
jgi:glycosyltransferase involved in cell wall biosynthesis